MNQEANGYAKLHVPDWVWGGSPRRLLESARLRSRRVTGADNIWAIQTEERYQRRPVQLLTLRTLAGPGAQPGAFSILASHPSLVEEVHGAQTIDRVNRLGERAQTSGRLAQLFTHAQLRLMLSPQQELPQVASDVVQLVREMEREGDSGDHPFVNAGLQFVYADQALLRRVKFASVWLRLEYDERMRSGDLSHIAADEGALAFNSASGLYSGMYMLDAYFAPLMGSLSPFVWGFTAARTIGQLILTIGRPIAGTEGDPAELLQSLATESGRSTVPASQVDPTSCLSAVAWWTNALNDLFAVVTDLALFVDENGFYNPSAHLHALLSIEQLFRRTLSIQYAHRDTHSRRVLLFTVLDTLQRLTGRPLETHCSLTFARRTLASLKDRIPDDVGKVLLPRAEDGVRALEELQKGFFMATASGHVKILGSGNVEEMTLEDAVSQYVKVLRDATHGHGSNRENRVGKTNSLLAQHNGDIPHELGWLGYMYALDMLTRPDALRNVLRSRNK